MAYDDCIISADIGVFEGEEGKETLSSLWNPS